MTQKQALECLTTLFADLRADLHPASLDAEDLGRLREIAAQAQNTIDEHIALETLRQQPWGERLSDEQNEAEVAAHQIASDVARLHEIAKQDPALLHAVLDSLHHSYQQLDLLQQPYVKTFTDAVRRSRGFNPQERQ